MSKYLGRGIHKEHFLKSLEDKKKLGNMINIIQENGNLDLQIRSNYIDIYYKGGRIAHIKGESSIDIDKKYFSYTSKISHNELIKVFKEDRDYKKYFDSAIDILDEWFIRNPKEEREDQHKLSLSNKKNNSDYNIIDLEYQVSTESPFKCTFIPKNKDKPKKPRFDIIAIDRYGKLCVIELKKGAGALSGTSGLKEHWECFKHSIDRNPDKFIEEMRRVLEQKQAFGIIDKNIKIKSDSVEFLFAYAYKGISESELKKEDEVFNREYEKIGKSIKVIRLRPCESFKLTSPD